MREHDAWFGHSSARVSRVLTKATSYLIALSLQPKEVGNDNRAEVKNDGFESLADIKNGFSPMSALRLKADILRHV